MIDSQDVIYQVYQVDNEIFYEGNEPLREHRFRCFEFSFFVFYKSNDNLTINTHDIETESGWLISGKWSLGDYTVLQFDGTGPIHRLNNNEMIVRAYFNELLSRGDLTTFKIRFRYPMLP